MGFKELKLKDLEGRTILFSGSHGISEGGNSKIKEYSKFSPQYMIQYERHDIPSAGLITPKFVLTNWIITLEQWGYGWYSVNMITDPLFGMTELYNSHSTLGSDTSIEIQEKSAREKYETLTKLIKTI